MCGIVGIVGQGRELLPAMRDAMAHRGPDGSGIWEDDTTCTALAHRRLAVLDLAGGHQPLVSDDGQTVLVYNGEIYNHLELRAELVRLGHCFHSDHSDVETVLHAWREWGEKACLRFNGMFAFAIWDKKSDSLFLARDRFGEKPLFYTYSSYGFAFASELQAFFPWPGFAAEIDSENLQRYFAWGYFPAGRTLYRQTYSLPPGSWMRVSLSSCERYENRYWRFQLEPDNSLSASCEPALIDELQFLIKQAVQRRLLSDVPLGVFLSGGIDSGTILDSMCLLCDPQTIQAFTIGFTERSFDESPQAALVARHYGVRHNVRNFEMNEAQRLIPHLLGQVADPLGDASLLPTAILSHFTREQVVVALSGDGGDELFAGYDPFKALLPAKIYSRVIPRSLHRLLRLFVELIPPSDANMSLDFKIRRTLRGLSYPENLQVPVWMSPAEPEQIRELFEHPLSQEELYEDALETWRRNAALSKQDQVLAFFTEHYLSSDILVKVDRATMLSSLESRAVFLDNDIVEFCRKLPFWYKMRGNNTKYLLKKAMLGRLPQEIVKRPKKGFGIPLNRWLRAMEIAPSTSTYSGLRWTTLHNYIVKHQGRQGDYRLLLWAWLALDLRKQ